MVKWNSGWLDDRQRTVENGWRATQWNADKRRSVMIYTEKIIYNYGTYTFIPLYLYTSMPKSALISGKINLQAAPFTKPRSP